MIITYCFLLTKITDVEDQNYKWEVSLETLSLPSCALSKHQFIDVNTLALSGQG